LYKTYPMQNYKTLSEWQIIERNNSVFCGLKI
jgi:hypothetical protein